MGSTQQYRRSPTLPTYILDRFEPRPQGTDGVPSDHLLINNPEYNGVMVLYNHGNWTGLHARSFTNSYFLDWLTRIRWTPSLGALVYEIERCLSLVSLSFSRNKNIPGAYISR